MIEKFLYFYFAVVLLWGGFLFSQENEEVLKETVRVVNVEVPVRVYYQGKPVDNLTKESFKLFEGRKRQDIHGFILKRKKIRVQETELNAEQIKIPKGRYFVLVFRITHYNDYLKRGLDYVFDTILKESDQLLVFANDSSNFFKSLADKGTVKSKLDQMLKDVSLDARNKTLIYLKQVEKEVDKHNFEMTLKSGRHTNIHLYVTRYLDKFLEIWKNYKKRYLIPDINKYYNFARFLKDIQQEKWVINFYQFEVFPNIIIDNESMRRIRGYVGEWEASDNPEKVTFSQIITRQMIEIEKELSVARDFPSEEVAKIFHNVDTTFHSVFMKTTFNTLLQDLEYREIASEVESSLRSITDRTGGELVVSNKLDTALERISEVEDIYYVLTYAPKDPDKVGKIRVKLNNRKYKLEYSPYLRTGYLGQFFKEKQLNGSDIKIEDLTFKKGKLRFAVSDFYWQKKEGGMLSIRIQIKDQQGKSIFDQKKAIKATQKKITIALNIMDLPAGEYDFVVDVNDLFTKMNKTQFLKTTIPNEP